ncbi:MAG TPA: ABC transporter permease [Bacteroidota bacterium]|nr:ABC transporter permease [Bacteroidota bacterium]
MKKTTSMITGAVQSAEAAGTDYAVKRFATLEAFLNDAGQLGRFTATFFRTLLTPPYEIGEFLRQAYLVGNKSVSLVGLTGFIMGIVLTMQSRPTLAEFGAESWLPAMVAISIVREIGPVVTALISAGKVGSGIGAELASMRVTEQIDAMQVSGTDPFKYIVTTRVLAVTVMIPVLTVFSDAFGMLGSYIGVNIRSDVSIRLFFTQAVTKLVFIDVVPALIKTFFFGFAIGLIGCFKGYYANSGTEGVGRAANAAVVTSSLLIFVIDMIAVQITSLFLK